MITAWDDDRRMTDADHGITAADVAGENLTVTVWPKEDRAGYYWEVWEDKPVAWDYFLDRPAWDGECVAGGTAATREQAEAAGETAKADYLRGLTGR